MEQDDLTVTLWHKAELKLLLDPGSQGSREGVNLGNPGSPRNPGKMMGAIGAQAAQRARELREAQEHEL